MKIRNLELPVPLVRLLSSNDSITSIHTERLEALLIGTETAIPQLFSLEHIVSANHFWDSRHVSDYLGREQHGSYPGRIDPTKTVIIGQAEPDSPIALDYRSDPPRLVYFADCGAWIELAESCEVLFERLGVSVPDSPPQAQCG